MARPSREPPDKAAPSEPRDTAPEVFDLAEAIFAGDGALFATMLQIRMQELRLKGRTEQELERWAEAICDLLGVERPR